MTLVSDITAARFAPVYPRLATHRTVEPAGRAAHTGNALSSRPATSVRPVDRDVPAIKTLAADPENTLEEHERWDGLA